MLLRLQQNCYKIAANLLHCCSKSTRNNNIAAIHTIPLISIHISPDLVHLDKMVPVSNQKLDPLVGDMITPPTFSYFQTIKNISANGVVGNPNFSSKEKGKRISQIITSTLVDIITTLS